MRIRETAMKEFLEKGYQGASLRKILRDSGVTTGTFYARYQNKEALFELLVGPTYRELVGRLRMTQRTFSGLSPEEQGAALREAGRKTMLWMEDFAYSHQDEIRLLLTGSEGTRYENTIRNLVEIEIDGLRKFEASLKALGIDHGTMDPVLERLLMTGVFYSFFEVVLGNIPRERAGTYLRQMEEFFTAGWKSVLGC